MEALGKTAIGSAIAVGVGHSDVDVVVDLDGRHLKFHEECRMLDELEFIFGRKVDMVLAESLASPKMNRHRRASIATTAKVVYDARS